MTWTNPLIVATALMAATTGIPVLATATTATTAASSGTTGTSGYYGAVPGDHDPALTRNRAAGLPPNRESSIGGSVRALLGLNNRIANTAPTWATPKAKLADANDRQIRVVQLALALRDPGGAQRYAADVSDPKSPRHRQYLTNREFTDRFGPSRDTIAQIKTWLRSTRAGGAHGPGAARVTSVSANRTLVTITATNAQLEKVFDAQLAHYRNPDGTRVTVAPDRDLAAPSGLHGVVNDVFGIGDTALARPLHHQSGRTQPAPHGDGRSSSSSSSDWRSARTSADRQAAAQPCARWWGERNDTSLPQKYPTGRQSSAVCGYNAAQTRGMHGLTARNTGHGQTVGIVGAYNLDTIASDTNRAAAEYGSPPLTPGQYSASLPPEFENQDLCAPETWAVEQALDVQAAHTTAPAAAIRYYGARSCTNAHLYAALNRAVEANQVDVISNSFGYPDEAELPATVHKQFGQIVTQAAAQGQSVLVSSGDSGDGSGASGKRQTSFPAASPWVTAVGGTSTGLDLNGRTKFTTGWADGGNTLAGGRWVRHDDKDGPFAGGAGGGRTTYYAQPAYQKGVVPNSIAAGKRTLPDISSLADPYTGFGIGITLDDQFVLTSAGGTSLASPLLAGIVANANQANRGKRVGFLNPALYAMRRDATVTDVKPVKAGAVTSYMSRLGGVTVPTGKGTYLVDLGGTPQTLNSATGWDTLTGIGAPARGFAEQLAQ